MISGDHSSKQYDQELESIRARILEMGGLVETQLNLAIEAFDLEDVARADQVIAADRRVNELEVELDRAVNNVIARRQPTASDLRLIMGVAKTIIDLERVGDESTKIARVARWLHEKKVPNVRLPRVPDIQACGAIVAHMLRGSLDSFARLDVGAAAAIIRDDQGVDERFRAILRQLITFMMEDPRTISSALDLLFIARAIERIGDHAKNIAEYVVYMVRGRDVRHIGLEAMEKESAR
jgi:phosphate transport system protein